MTGYHPDFGFLEKQGIKLDPKSRRPEINPETLESNVPSIYLAGVIVGGMHTGEIFIENGRFHGRQIIAAITGKGKLQGVLPPRRKPHSESWAPGESPSYWRKSFCFQRIFLPRLRRTAGYGGRATRCSASVGHPALVLEHRSRNRILDVFPVHHSPPPHVEKS